jgi:hypothetical protein
VRGHLHHCWQPLQLQQRLHSPKQQLLLPNHARKRVDQQQLTAVSYASSNSKHHVLTADKPTSN